MKYLKFFEELGEGAYPGPPLTGGMNGTGFLSSTLTAGASDGIIGGEFPKKYAPPKGPTHDKFRQNVTQVGKKDSKQRKDAIKKLDKLSKMMSFDDFKKEKKK